MSDIVIRLTIDAAQLNTALADVRNKLTDVGAKQVDIDTSAAEAKITSLRDNIAMWGLAIQGAVGAMNMIGGAISRALAPANDFEQMRLRLNALYQDTDKATAAWERFEDVARKTPATLQQVVEAGAALKAYGMDAEATLDSVSDLAAYMGMNVVEAAQAVGRAFAGGAGAADILRERGVLQLVKSFKGIEDLTKLTLPEFREALISTMQDPAAGIAGTSAEMADSFAGSVANMEDALTTLAAKLGQVLTPALGAVARTVADVVEWFSDLHGVTKAAIILTPALVASWTLLKTTGLALAITTGGLSGAFGYLSTALGVASMVVKNFFASMGPVGWAIMGLGAAIAALGVVLNSNKKKMEENARAAREMREATEDVKTAADAEVRVFQSLINKLLELKSSEDKSTKAKQAKKSVISEINNKYGSYLGNLDLERASYDQIAAAANKAATAIMQKKLAEGYGALAGEQAKVVAGLKREWDTLLQEYQKLRAEENWLRANLNQGDTFQKSFRLTAISSRIKEIMAFKETYRAAMNDLRDLSEDYANELTKLPVEFVKSDETPSAKGSGTTSKKTAASEYERLMQELAELEMTATEKLDAEWGRRYEVIIKHTREDSAERKAALSSLATWEMAEWNKIQDAEEAAEAERERIRHEAQARLGANTAEYYDEVKFLDAGYYEWKKGQIAEDVVALELGAEQAQLLLDQRMEALDAEKKAWDTKDREEQQKRLQEALEATAEAHKQYYEQVTFADSDYYEWKKTQIELEAAALKLTEEEHQRLLAIKLGALEKEREAYEALPIEEIKDRYNDFKSSAADSSVIGVAAWDSIRKGLQGFRNELAEFADQPGVKELLAQIDAEIEEAKERSTNRGNWFWHGLMGFDPDKAEDQQKIQRLKDTFGDLQGMVNSIMSSLSQQSQQRWDDEVAALEARAEKEHWTAQHLADQRLIIDKKYDAESRKIRNVQKASSIAQATINTAEAVTKALTLGPILGPIAAGAISALGAIQIMVIAKQRFAGGGLFRGKGGPRDDQNIIMVSDGEYIVNAQSTKRYKHVLDAINYGTTHAAAYPRFAYAEGGTAPAGGGTIIDALLKKIDALNMNVSKLETQVAVIVNAPDIDVQVERYERAKNRLLNNRKAFSYGI